MLLKCSCRVWTQLVSAQHHLGQELPWHLLGSSLLPCLSVRKKDFNYHLLDADGSEENKAGYLFLLTLLSQQV